MWSLIKMTTSFLKSPVMTVLFSLLPPISVYLLRSSSTCQTIYKCTTQEKHFLEEQPQRKQAQLRECCVMTYYFRPLDRIPLCSRKSSLKTSFMVATISASSLLSFLTPARHLIPPTIARFISSALRFNLIIF